MSGASRVTFIAAVPGWDVVLPVTVENEDWERVNFAVRQPDGRLFIPEMQDFATDDDLIVYFAEEERSARNRIAKKSAGS